MRLSHRSFARPRCGALVALSLCVATIAPAVGGEHSFPYDKELMLDVRPMKGSKRVPLLEVAANGRATIDLWCNSLQGQFIVAANTITVIPGPRTTERQCDAQRMRSDEELLAALEQVTGWSREGAIIVLTGTKPLRFRPLTN